MQMAAARRQLLSSLVVPGFAQKKVLVQLGDVMTAAWLSEREAVLLPNPTTRAPKTQLRRNICKCMAAARASSLSAIPGILTL